MPTQPVDLFPSTSPVSYRKLPEHPDLEQLRRQAKELLRDYQAGELAALEEVERYFHPVPGAELTLAEAQLVLARAYGYQSWPRFKAYIDGVNKGALAEAIRGGDLAEVQNILRRRPELALGTTGEGEQGMVHLAVIHDRPEILRLLLENGANARSGIYPHRESTTALCMAEDRGHEHLVRIILEAELERKRALSCPNVGISPAQEELAALIRDGQTAEALARLQAQPDLLRQCDREGATPLHLAAEVPDETLVQWMFTHGADPNKLDATGNTAADRVVSACGWFKWDKTAEATLIVELLRGKMRETTPLMAVALGDRETLRQIHAATPARLSEGYPWGRGGLLSAATVFRRPEVVKLLLELGLHPDEPIALGRGADDTEDWSWGGPLWRAAAINDLEIATILLDHGADPNANVYASGWPLDRAYQFGHQAMIDLLYARGAKPSPYTVCGSHDLPAGRRLFEEKKDDAVFMREMVWASAFCNNLPLLELVLPRLIALQDQLTATELNWADLLYQPMRMQGPVDFVRPADYQDSNRFTIMRMMLEASGQANARGRLGLTSLHFVAARSGDRGHQLDPEKRNRFAKLLLENGADPALRDEMLCASALGWACRYGRLELVRLLLAHGVPVEEPDTPTWAQPRAHATRHGFTEILTLLGT
jgi:ankyrin repeat protein